MTAKRLEISGLRGFARKQTLELAKPNGKLGSGLTFVVGPNNAGKSTIIDAFRFLADATGARSVSVGQRNHLADSRIAIALSYDDDSYIRLETVERGGSETRFTTSGRTPAILGLPSRRHFSAFFGRSVGSREQYARELVPSSQRGAALDSFCSRLFQIQNANDGAFDKLLGEILNPIPAWRIELSDGGQYFLQFESGSTRHNSDGAGEGILSVFFIVDALYDSKPDDIIVIDEPELSLHPALQRRVADLLLKYSSDRQVVVATHSPYFVDVAALAAGARLARVHKQGEESCISMLRATTASRIAGIALDDMNNPHVFGLDAREVFFQDDRIILVEGQEDVVCYRRIEADLEAKFGGHFFGWGVGGADKMSVVAAVMADLGFQHVVGILDSDKASLKAELESDFPSFSFFVIPAKDVRSKPQRKAADAVDGIMKDGAIQPAYRDQMQLLLRQVRQALKADDAGSDHRFRSK